MKGPIRNFGVILTQLEDGDLMAALSNEFCQTNEKLAEQAAFVNRKVKGEVTLKLRMVHNEKGAVEIEGEITSKTPKLKRSQTLLWVAPGGEIVTQNPRQRTFDEHVREVPKPDAREVPESRIQKEA